MERFLLSPSMDAVVARFLELMMVVSLATDAKPDSGWRPLPASSLLGREVVTLEGRPIGEVEDLLLDMRNARVEYALVDTGARLAVIPAAALQVQAGTRRLEMRAGEPPAAADAPPASLVRASRLSGWRVTDRTGKYAGEIEDAVIDPRNNLVLHVLFDYDESWGPDQPPLRLAPQAFRFPLEGGPAVVNIRRERLEDPDESMR